MKKQLILAEKPSVARDFARVLKVNKKNKGYFESEDKIVTWALGHLVTLATPDEYNKKYQKWDMEDLPIIPNELKLTVIKSSRPQFNIVKSLINRQDVGEIVIATDAGREGELVARLILKLSGNRKTIKRLWISSVTDKAIKDGFSKLKAGKEYDNLYDSALARAQADWIVGINATRALTTKYNASLSCGRVQTPTLNLIKLREDEIRDFKSIDLFSLRVSARGITFTYLDNKNMVNIKDESKLDKIIEEIKGQALEVVDVKRTKKKKYPDKLYDLTNLQRDANVRFGFSAKETLNIMQSLYERHKVLSYPRTDSRYLTQDIVATIPERLKAMNTSKYREYISKINKDIRGSKNFVDDTKVSDHHAIIPTEEPLRLEELNSKELKIYDLVAKRFLSHLMKAYEYEEIKISAKYKDYNFTAKGKIEVNLGYKLLDSYEESEDEENQVLENINIGNKLKIDTIKKNKSKTSPPAYFNEGSLLLAMENPNKYIDINKDLAKTLKESGGIGTVATRADIIEKLYKSDLIVESNSAIKITSKGRQLLQLVPEKLKSPILTAKWEEKLTDIEKGKLKDQEFLKEIKDFSKDNIEEIKKSEKKYHHENLSGTKCEKCGKLMLSVSRKDREMLVCQDPSCGHRVNISVMTKSRCPNCKKRLKLVFANESYVCDTCGYRESKKSMEKKFKANENRMKKSEVKKYLSTQKDSDINNLLADKLKGLKFGD